MALVCSTGKWQPWQLKKWYFVAKIVLVNENNFWNSRIRSIKDEVREFAKNLSSLEQFIDKGQNNFWNRIIFKFIPKVPKYFTSSTSFPNANLTSCIRKRITTCKVETLENSRIKIGKYLGFKNIREKLEKRINSLHTLHWRLKTGVCCFF